jgi:CDP-diacylglycerol pyrophosphatase
MGAAPTSDDPPLRRAFAVFSSLLTLLALTLLALTCAPRPAGAFEGRAFGRDGLWRIVHGICAPVSRVTGVALPCLAVDRDKGSATLRAPDDDTHIIVTPLEKVSGVESPSLLRTDAPNYWATAWSQRDWVVQGAGQQLRWNDLGMAVNSRPGRSQDQLHIHVDCVQPTVRKALARAVNGQKSWFDLDLRPSAGLYRARRLKEGDLDQNIFRMVATEIPHARDDMARQTIAMIGVEDAKHGRGFVLLVAGNGGHAEELLDHRCQLARG